MDNSKRYVLVNRDGIWGPPEPVSVLRAGDRFKLFESDGQPVIYRGIDIFTAMKSFEVNDAGIGIVQVE